MELAIQNEKEVQMKKQAEKALHELAKVRAQKTALANKEKELMKSIKGMGIFDFENYDKEQFVGETVIANKVPYLTGTHYDLDKVRKLADSLKMSRKLLINRKVVCSVNEVALQELVANDTVPQELIDSMAIKGNKVTVKIVQ